MQRVHLTKRQIDAFVYEGENKERDGRWDDRLPGFGVRIYPSGCKSFVLSYRWQGRKRLMVLGRYGVLTLEMARDKARQALVDSNGGEDPLDQRAKMTHGATVADLATAYMDRHAKIHKKSWKDDQRAIDKYILSKWSSKKVKELARPDIALLHQTIGQKYPLCGESFIGIALENVRASEALGISGRGRYQCGARDTAFQGRKARSVYYSARTPTTGRSHRQ